MPKDKDNDRRTTANELHEHLRGPLPDDVRSEIEAALREEKAKDAKPWWRFGKK